MVILQFNKLIRNTWVWGVFAVAVSAAFCFDDLFTSRGDGRGPREAGKLGDKAVSASEFAAFADDARGFGRMRDGSRKMSEINREAWQNYAAFKTAEQNGVVIGDGLLLRSIQGMFGGPQGSFSYDQYRMYLAENLQTTPQRFEDSLRRRLAVDQFVNRAVLGSATWVSPMEVDQAVYDVTDVYTVKVARFAEKNADQVKVDDAGLEKWYNANTNALALPERVKIRSVRFDATAPELLAKMEISDDELHDYYDQPEIQKKYTSTDTNGVETVKTFDEVRGEIDAALRQVAAVECLMTNVQHRAYADGGTPDVSRLDEIAKADGLKVEKSDWFTVAGGYQEGFMRPSSAILPGAKDFAAKVSAIDSEVEDLRYEVVVSDKAVWLIEKAEVSPAHVPTFEEAKPCIGARALRDARADAFKAEVEAVAAKGAEVVLASGDVSTNLTFSICDMNREAIADSMAVAGAVRKLAKGDVSEFTLVRPGEAIVVVCVDRVPGAADKQAIQRGNLGDQLAYPAFRKLTEDWPAWNLERLGFTPNENSAVTEETYDDAEI